MVVLRYAQEILASIGAAVLALCAATGALLIFAATAVSHLVRPPFYPVEIGRQLLRIGWFSLPVVGLTTLFTGGRWRCRFSQAARASTRNRWCRRSWRSAWCANWGPFWAD